MYYLDDIMDIVTDLTAQAVSFITVLQDTCKSEKAPTGTPEEGEYLWEILDSSKIIQEKCTQRQVERIREIVWYGSTATDEKIKEHFSLLGAALLFWLKEQIASNNSGIIHLIEGTKIIKRKDLTTPFYWRKCIRYILYVRTEERIKLAKAINYMPIQVLLCLGGDKLSKYSKKLFQVFLPVENNVFSELDQRKTKNWWNHSYGDNGIRRDYAEKLINHDKLLLAELLKSENTLSFEVLFNGELDEISASRKMRFPSCEDSVDLMLREEQIKTYAEMADNVIKDPLVRAERMDLYGLALSGGGIRSATFNLGILQKLAEKNILQRIDYLSTVSGGGYIGSWLVSWIKRTGSLSKVTDRLDTKMSADPMAEEVRPIRWLRMYSNYLAPDASIMSADSWTVGITWLRNTLINQFVLLLILCTGLSFVDLLFSFWTYLVERDHNYSSAVVTGASIIALVPAAVLASMGMYLYDKKYASVSPLNFVRRPVFSWMLLTWLIIASFSISTWLFHDSSHFDFWRKIQILFPAGIVAFISMWSIALYGRYHNYEEYNEIKWQIHLAVIISSIIAATAGMFSLGAIWELFGIFQDQSGQGKYVSGNPTNFIRVVYKTCNASELLFIIGVPLVLEVISFGVVVRMMIMGRLFPDERREWWGRMGAIVHRFSLSWLLLATCAIILPEAFKITIHNWDKISAILTGWVAIIGYAVKLAYSSSTSLDKKSQKGWTARETFIRFAPYLFMIGVLLIGAYTLEFTRVQASKMEQLPRDNVFFCFLITASLFFLTFLLSWRTGVNEFSLHHFYRNRLVRAYLGATRRRRDRNETVNNFTGFDKMDDIKLSKFQTKDLYFGPFPLINAALNATVVSELDRQDRKAESFVFSPLYCGFDFSATASAASSGDCVFNYGYRPTEKYAYESGPKIGTAMAISGAAVNPNMGYHSSAATAFLLTVFNVRLGWWIGNPRLKDWKHSDPKTGIFYIIKDLIGKSDVDSDYVCLSDGGHFDNMGLYELVRRKCKYIILGDGEEDVDGICEGLANAIRRCRIDFGVEITIETTDIVNKNSITGFCSAHVAEGTIRYPGEDKATGKLIYIKASLTGDESTDIREYKQKNELFPQQSTGDQFFDEEQFESYRNLGYHSLDKVFPH